MGVWVVAGTIDLLAYTDKENEVPLDWEESDPRYIANAADVKLRAFSTKVGGQVPAGQQGSRAGAVGGQLVGHEGSTCRSNHATQPPTPDTSL